MLEAFRKYEVQARFAMLLATISLVPCAVAVFLGWRNFNFTLGRIVYGSGGNFVIVFAGCVLLSLGVGALAFVLGLNSAGQKRNDRSGQSWLAFFLGGTVLTADLILLIAFYLLRLKV